MIKLATEQDREEFYQELLERDPVFAKVYALVMGIDDDVRAV